MQVPVLIVGGGPIGLMASVLLSRFGIESLLVNERATTSTHPRARFIDVRTTEVLRQVDLADDVLATGLPPEWVESVRYSLSFADPEVYRLPTASYDCAPRGYSPTVPIMTAQDLVEPIMLEAATSYRGADVRFGTVLTALSQSPGGCRATIRDLASGVETRLTADYVVGADGRHSSVRDLLGGDLDVGFTQAMSIQDVLYHGDMSPWVGDRIGALLFAYHPMGYGLFQPMDGKTRWRAQCTTFTPAIPPGDITEADCVAWIRSAIGDVEGVFEPQVESIAPWTPEARLSDDFRRDRVFLAGDAAHMLYPTGGLGMNLGYHGIHNLIWKLAFVLRGVAVPEILETYETERRPQADRTRHVSVENARLAGDLYRTYAAGGDLAAAGHELRQYGNFEGLVLGNEYRSSLCRAEGTEGVVAEGALVDFDPVVRVGRRAPHVWLDTAKQRSLLDEFGTSYVVVRGSTTAANLFPQVDALSTRGFPIRQLVLPQEAQGDLYAADASILVRPDGVVAAHLDPLGDDLGELCMAELACARTAT